MAKKSGKFLAHSLKVSLAPKEERHLNYTPVINQQYLPGTGQVLSVAVFSWGLCVSFYFQFSLPAPSEAGSRSRSKTHKVTSESLAQER